MDKITLALSTLDEIKTELKDNDYKIIADGLGERFKKGDYGEKKLYTMEYTLIEPESMNEDDPDCDEVVMGISRRKILVIATDAQIAKLKHNGSRVVPVGLWEDFVMSQGERIVDSVPSTYVNGVKVRGMVVIENVVEYK